MLTRSLLKACASAPIGVLGDAGASAAVSDPGTLSPASASFSCMLNVSIASLKSLPKIRKPQSRLQIAPKFCYLLLQGLIQAAIAGTRCHTGIEGHMLTS